MRGSAFLVPLELADDIIAATRRDSDWQPAVLRSRGLDAETYAALRPLVLEAASEPLTPTDLRRALGVGADDDRAYFTMRLMAREGSILRVGTGRVRSDDLRWVSTEAWLGRSLGDGDPDAALARLAAAYLQRIRPGPDARLRVVGGRDAPSRERGHRIGRHGRRSPTTFSCRAISSLFGRRASRSTPKRSMSCRNGTPTRWATHPTAGGGSSTTRTSGSRTRPPDTKIGATAGDGLPLILRGGRAVATWSHRLSGKTMSVTVSPFDMTASEGDELLAKTASEFERIGQLFEARVETSLAAR